MSRLLKAFAFLMLAAVLGAVWIWTDAHQPYLRAQPPVDVDIAPGTNSRRIAQQLEEAGVIRHHETFLVLHYLRKKQTLKAGFYSFDHPLAPKDVLRELISGEMARQELTIPEGLNHFDIAALVEEAGLVKRDEFLKAAADSALIADLDPSAPGLEGYLFPDTYQFPRHSGAVPIVRAMVNRFRQVYG